MVPCAFAVVPCAAFQDMYVMAEQFIAPDSSSGFYGLSRLIYGLSTDLCAKQNHQIGPWGLSHWGVGSNPGHVEVSWLSG